MDKHLELIGELCVVSWWRVQFNDRVDKPGFSECSMEHAWLFEIDRMGWEPEHSLPLCGQRLLDYRMIWEYHRFVHGGDPEWQCPECRRRVDSVIALESRTYAAAFRHFREAVIQLGIELQPYMRRIVNAMNSFRGRPRREE